MLYRSDHQRLNDTEPLTGNHQRRDIADCQFDDLFSLISELQFDQACVVTEIRASAV
jgi:hypothetical protein